VTLFNNLLAGSRAVVVNVCSITRFLSERLNL